jgi:hypothetical protein
MQVEFGFWDLFKSIHTIIANKHHAYYFKWDAAAHRCCWALSLQRKREPDARVAVLVAAAWLTAASVVEMRSMR